MAPLKKVLSEDEKCHGGGGCRALVPFVKCDERSVAFPSTASSGAFATIGRRCNTDKIGHHGYHRYYPRYLEHFRSLTGGAMLEIGIDQECSLGTWLEYFPEAFIYGVDIGVEAAGPRHKIVMADQGDKQAMRHLVEREIKHEVFFVIDDGSHLPEHQVQCFDYLFRELLLPGGVYIIEDIETSYWTKSNIYGYRTRYGYHHGKSAVEIFKDLADDINAEFMTTANRRTHEQRVGSDISSATRNEVSSITFGQNCIVVAKKTREEHVMFDDRRYRFESKL